MKGTEFQAQSPSGQGWSGAGQAGCEMTEVVTTVVTTADPYLLTVVRGCLQCFRERISLNHPRNPVN